MRVIVAGSRDITELTEIETAIRDSKFEITELVSGTARGVDSLGEEWARAHSIPIKHFPAKWNRGLQAGLERNVEMANYAHALIAIWDGKSPGTKHMIETAYKNNLYVYIRKLK